MKGRTLGRIALAAGAALIATFGMAGPAFAHSPIPLNEGQQNKTAAAFTSSCENVPIGKEAGFDSWVFILPGSGCSGGASFTKLTLTFKDTSGATHTVVINSTTATIDGQATDGGIIVKANAQDTSKAWVQIPSGWTLVNGSAEITTGAHNEFFNVTHVCKGGESTPSPSPSSSSSGSETPSESGSEEGGSSSSSSGGGGGGGSLPTTGAKIGVIVGVGLGLVAAGVGLVALRRRRDMMITP